jgi:hypothetical protein
MAAKKRAGRGSDKMVAGLSASQGRALLAAISGWKVTDWFPLGKPGIEVLTGGISGRPSRVSAAVAKLLRVKEIRDIEILINGQPRPDLANIRFTMRPGR